MPQTSRRKYIIKIRVENIDIETIQTNKQTNKQKTVEHINETRAGSFKQLKFINPNRG